MLRKGRGRKHKLKLVEVNIITLMDILTTLLFFVLFLASFNSFNTVPAEAVPQGASEQSEDKPTFSLQVILLKSNEAYVWVGPINRLKPRNMAEIAQYLKDRFKGDDENGYFRKVKAKNSVQLRGKLQSILRRIKISFPNELKAVAAFSDKISYDDLVQSVQAFRELPDSKAMDVVRRSGRRESTTVLFPQIVITDWVAEESNVGGV